MRMMSVIRIFQSRKEEMGNMIATLLLSLQMMAGLFLLLLGGVGFIQDKRFFSSAPAQTQAVVPASKPERFPGQHTVGWVMVLLAFALMGGALVLGGWDGIRNGFGFWQFALRFFVMLMLLKAFDVLFFDWYLLCNAGLNFFPHFYPETKTVLGRCLFGYNRKTHLTHILLFPVASAALAWICTLF